MFYFIRKILNIYIAAFARIIPINKTARVLTSNPLISEQDKIVDIAAKAYIKKIHTISLSIGILKDGNVNLYNYGETVKGNQQLPTPGTLYEIGSITKTFAAAILSFYANEGRLSLTDPITKYLPAWVVVNTGLKDITLLNLINHTSGLPRLPGNLTSQKPRNRLNPYQNYNENLLYAYLKTCRLNTAPGQHYAYSNLGAGLLGHLLEKISGQTFEQMVAEIICKPLGMKNTAQHLSPVQKTNFAVPYSYGLQTPAWDFDVLAACGALKSTTEDLLLYVKANLNDSEGTPLSKAFKLARDVTFNNKIMVGLAWHILEIAGSSYYFHNGGTYGSSSFLAFNKEKKLAVIVLSNAAASTDAVGVDIIKKLQ